MPDLQYRTPFGHSVAAHRVHGWCALCPDRTPDEELIAWRTHERRRHMLGELLLQVHASAEAVDDRPCPACGRETLALVTVFVTTDAGHRLAGGWVACRNTDCQATPHPVLEEPRG
ncbi:hypothetical protein ACFY0A_39720 [Streptomyces sp. NPDC001698]|uniref:hypothetical protein n=1 Tax=Streptomyces sp. NPDC001698 TaxID=3364601 RepID=UPI00367E7443